MRQSSSTHQKDRFNSRSQRRIVHGNGLFKLKVARIAHATENKSRTYFPAEVDRKALKLHRLHGTLIGCAHRLYDGQPFVGAKESFLGTVGTDGDVNLIKDRKSTRLHSSH